MMKCVRNMVLSIVLLVVLANSAFACAALTNKGTPCRRAAVPGSPYCWQHGGGRQAIQTSKNSQAPLEADKRSNVQRKEDTLKQRVLQHVSDGRIHKIFGFDVGEILADYSNAKKLSDKKFRVNSTMKLSAPFTVCKHVSCFYSAKGRRLFKITLSSDEYLNPDVNKMLKRIAEMSKAVDAKFHEELEMVNGELGCSSRFKSDVKQKLSIDIVGVGKNKKKLVITFIDKEIELD